MPWKFFTSSGKEKLTEEERNPSGMIVQYASSTAPTGWLACDGSQIAIANYPELYKAVGTSYGALTDGSGSAGTTHFRLPDLRGRIPIGMHAGAGNGTTTAQGSTIYGASRSGTGATNGTAISSVAVGTTGGAESATVTAAQSGNPSHDHTIGTSGNHNHTVSVSGSHAHVFGTSVGNFVNAGGNPGFLAYGGSTFGPNYYNTSSNGIGAPSLTGTSGVTATNSETGADATSSHSNVQPSLVINFIIKT